MTRGLESSTAASLKAVRPPPRVLVRAFWSLHRSIYRVSRGSLGLWRPKEGKRFGVMLVESRGRHTGRERRTMAGYFEDDGNLITIAMNGWAAAEPAWWLNLQTAPDTRVRTADGFREVRAHPATGSERERLWGRSPQQWWCSSRGPVFQQWVETVPTWGVVN